MKKEIKFLIIIFLLSVSLRLVFIDTSYFIWDEAVYLLHGKMFAGVNVGYEELSSRPPLISLIISPLWHLGNFELAVRILIAIINSLIVVPVYYLGKILSKKTGMISAILIAILPASVTHSRYILTDHMGALLALTTILFFFLGTKERKSKLLYIGSIFLTLSILMKFTNILLFLLLIPFLIMLLAEKRIKEILISGAVFLATLSPYLLFNYLSFGEPLHTFLKAWRIVAKPVPVNFDFFAYIFNDTFGLIFLVVSLIGFIAFARKILSKPTIRNKFLTGTLIFIFIVALAYFIGVVNIEVAKQPTIEWEAERFMLLSITFFTIFIGYGLLSLSKLVGKKYTLPFIAIIFILGLFLLSPQIMRTYDSQIEFENGLRNITKEMGLFLKSSDIQEFACWGNCPPIAYYSEKKMNVFYSQNDLTASETEYKVIFKEIENSNVIESFCKEEWCVYLHNDK
ncbi:MAG: glycosyltransferase family 39 protein [Candidatus Aenigmarchaeota archaeon]|nr:glycosyltransferase family 39 protein [Candidatus Aenigmarchaeota archaeon]